MHAEAAARRGQAFLCLQRRGEAESKLKCCIAVQACVVPSSSECFLRFGVCVGLLAMGDLTSSRAVLCPGEQSGTLLWRFLGFLQVHLKQYLEMIKLY